MKIFMLQEIVTSRREIGTKALASLDTIEGLSGLRSSVFGVSSQALSKSGSCGPRVQVTKSPGAEGFHAITAVRISAW